MKILRFTCHSNDFTLSSAKWHFMNFGHLMFNNMRLWKISRAHSNLIFQWNVTFLFSFLLVSYLEHTVHRWSCNKEKIRNTCTGSFKLLVRKIFAESIEKVRNWFFLNSFSNYKLIKMILSIFSLIQDLNDVVLAAFLCWITLKHFRGKIHS